MTTFTCRACYRVTDLADLAELPCSCCVCAGCGLKTVEAVLRGARPAAPAAPAPTAPAVPAPLEPGDAVLYSTADGILVEATVEIVDLTCQPPQYGIQLPGADNLRFTERHRLLSCEKRRGTRTPSRPQTPPARGAAGPAHAPAPTAPSGHCPVCSVALGPPALRALAPAAFAAWEAERTASWLKVNDVISCPHPGCGALIQRVPLRPALSPPPNRQPPQHQPSSPYSYGHLSPAQLAAQRQAEQLAEAQAHRARHRYRCGACGRDFCDRCRRTPYHDKYTCAQAAAPDCLLCGGKVSERRLAELLPCAAADAASAAAAGSDDDDGGRGGGSQPHSSRRGHGADGGTEGAGAGGGSVGAVVGRAHRSELLRALRDQLGVDVGWCLERRDLERALLHWGCNTCSAPACDAKRRAMCCRPLPCGHWCCGLRGEADAAAADGFGHPRCAECGADPSCGGALGSPVGGAAASPARKGLGGWGAGPSAAAAGPQGDCCFCWEPLPSAPCVQMGCAGGHVCHLHCATARLAAGYPGPHISFAHLYCPLCRSASSGSSCVQAALGPVHLSHPALAAALAPHLELREAVVGAVRQRLKLDAALRADPDLGPGGRFEGRVADWGLEKLLFYKCAKCAKPYFGGLRSCGAAAGAEQPPQQQQQQPGRGGGGGGGAGGGGAGGGAAAGAAGQAQDLVCGECCARSTGTNCPRHGTQYIEWKCRYCCSLASWFCFGTTHMCEPCHSLVPRGRPPASAAAGAAGAGGAAACRDPACGLKGIPHPPPGSEACLGCGMCRAGL
ncbi:hypothetical protein HYH03_016411 [Edaphochlamys debaryana]|uniref:IBR domain-containing protein n=1 Tax=Edaphochlamys debaryana TaxID=47281 RepID=A0A835XHJ4_9CHLO|nr:hypothetical protein HYH03_016411 [Edaphochlamys debaryana]|eukprot:KAG2484757.1 hypothetical protein HYH03_016411 [Edaphochlamys debaryana]